MLKLLILILCSSNMKNKKKKANSILKGLFNFNPI